MRRQISRLLRTNLSEEESIDLMADMVWEFLQNSPNVDPEAKRNGAFLSSKEAFKVHYADNHRKKKNFLVIITISGDFYTLLEKLERAK